MLTVIARYKVIRGHEAEVAGLLRRNAEASRLEVGCLEFSIYQNQAEATLFLLYEVYRSEEAFQAHRRTPHFRTLVEQQIVPLLAERSWTRIASLP